jgi:hypothetical protein
LLKEINMNFRKFLTVAAVSAALIVPALSVPAYAQALPAAVSAEITACGADPACIAVVAITNPALAAAIAAAGATLNPALAAQIAAAVATAVPGAAAQVAAAVSAAVPEAADEVAAAVTGTQNNNIQTAASPN